MSVPPRSTVPLAPAGPSIAAMWIVTAAASAAILVLTWPGAVRSSRLAEREESTLVSASQDANAIVALRASVPNPVSNQSQGGLTPRITVALQRAGLPATVLASLSPEAESRVEFRRGIHVLRRRATLTLSGVTLPQVGRFLDSWRSTEPAWTPASIDLSPVGGSPPVGGGDLPLRVVIAIETAMIAHDGDQQ